MSEDIVIALRIRKANLEFIRVRPGDPRPAGAGVLLVALDEPGVYSLMTPVRMCHEPASHPSRDTIPRRIDK